MQLSNLRREKCHQVVNPNVAYLHREKTAMLARYHAICGCADLGQDSTYGQVRLDLSKPVRSHMWRTLARFSSTRDTTLGLVSNCHACEHNKGFV